jgi:hypothetical protein
VHTYTAETWHGLMETQQNGMHWVEVDMVNRGFMIRPSELQAAG